MPPEQNAPLQSPSTLPEWLPPDAAGMQTMPCRRWLNTVKASSFDGMRTISRLAEWPGSVVCGARHA
jgi:hypothetical protein